jgi:hypothetical protein
MMTESDFWITLTEDEVQLACRVAVARHMESFKRKSRDNHGLRADDGTGLCFHVEGCCGELAYSKWRGLPWTGHINSFKGADVGKAQVRTRSRHDYDLIVRHDDKNEDPFVLLTGSAPRYWLRGWLWGHEAKRDKYLRAYGNRPEAWFVPASDLTPFTEKSRAAASA